MEAPHLSKIAKQHADKGLVVLAPNAWNEDKGMLKRYVRKEKLKQRILLDGAEVFEAYGGKSVPTVLFIDREGIVVDVEIGFDGGSKHLEEKAAALLSSG